jgi:hypothetical protein
MMIAASDCNKRNDNGGSLLDYADDLSGMGLFFGSRTQSGGQPRRGRENAKNAPAANSLDSKL